MQDRQSAGPKPNSRRGFFIGAATVGAAAVAVTVVPKVVEPPATSEAPALPPPAEKGGGYSLSEHVKRYYKTAST